MQIGSLELTPLSDGYFRMPPGYFGQDDWGQHAALAGPDGNIEIPVGCFLIRTGGKNVLIDAGLGPVPHTDQFGGGALIDELAKHGVTPEDIDLLVMTHLHFDHIGWSVQQGALTFPNATHRFSRQDLEHFVEHKPDPFAVETIEVLERSPQIDPIDADGEIAPGVSTMHAPGHTPGHRCIVISSGDERAFLLGDAVTCPVQLQETDWEAMSDVDKALAKRTRETLWKELEGSGAQVVGAHWPGLEFGRVLTGNGKRYWA